MAGKILLCILGVLVLLMAVALLIPIRAMVSYGQGDLAAWVKAGPLRIPLYPRPEKAEGEKKAKKEKKKPKKKKEEETPSPEEGAAAEETEKKKVKKLSVNLEQILYSLETLPPILGRALRRLGRRIRIRPLKVHLLVAGRDPADTAQLYGRLEGALSVLLPVVRRHAHIREEDIRLFLDFQEEKPECIAEIGISIRLWDLLVIGACAGGSALKWLLRFRKLATKKPAAPPEAAKPEEEKDTATVA